jgi:putative PIN family toxin of toxin-antitoxin system
MRRIVIDTNVVVPALLFGGVPGRLVPLWKEGNIHPIGSAAIFEEYLKVLAYPRFQLDEGEIDYLISVEILPYFEIVTVGPGDPYVVDDPADDRFVWCALAGKADGIISGDDPLLRLRNPPVPILTVAEFLRRRSRRG